MERDNTDVRPPRMPPQRVEQSVEVIEEKAGQRLGELRAAVGLHPKKMKKRPKVRFKRKPVMWLK